MKKVICLLVVGEKYNQVYLNHKEQFERYALKTNASLKIIDTPPDPGFYRSLLVQKLLIPGLVKEYDVALYLDLDIILNEQAPSIFDQLPADKSFGAVIDNRDTEEFKKTWRIKNETVSDYFAVRHFAPSEKLVGSINGGVFIFRPKEVAHLFETYYYSDHNKGVKERGSYEEAPMAYLTQTQGLFHSIDPRFNVQMIYKIRGTAKGRRINRQRKIIPKFMLKLYKKINKEEWFPFDSYRSFANEILKDSWILHFAGGYPLPKTKTEVGVS